MSGIAQPRGLKPDAGTDERCCGGCAHWDPYLPSLGDCLAYAKARQAAFSKAEDLEAFKAKWPQLAAESTGIHDVCDDWEANA